MGTLNPTLSGGVSFEQPVSPPPTGLSAVTSLLGVFTEKREPTEKERTNAALSTYAARLEELKNSDMSDADFQKSVRSLTRQQLTATPEYSTDVKRISEMYGATPEPLKTPVEDALTIQMNEYMATPEGQADLIAATVVDDRGYLDEQATRGRFYQSYVQNRAELAAIERSGRELTLLETDEKKRGILAKKKIDEFLPMWSSKVEGFTSSVIQQAASHPDLDTPEEQLAFLRQNRMLMQQSYTAKAQAAGLRPDEYNTLVTETLKPIDNLIDLAYKTKEDSAMVLEAFRNASQYGVEKELLDIAGPLSALPQWREQILPLLISESFYRQNAGEKLEALREFASDAEAGDVTFTFMPRLPNTPQEAATEDSIVDPISIDKMSRRIEADPKYFDTTFKTATTLIETTGNLSDPRARKGILDQVARLGALSEASDSALGNQYLNTLFSPSNIRIFAQVASGSDQAAVDLTNSLTYMAAKQVRRNRAILDAAIAQANPNLGLSYEVKNGKVVVYSNGKVYPVDFVSTVGVGDIQASISKAVKNINFLNASMGRITKTWAEAPAKETLGPQGEPNMESIQDYLMRGGAGDTELPGSAGEDLLLVSLVDRVEGAADYDTLFRHSQREGEDFAGTKVSEMTIGELLGFSSGEYGKWSKEQLGYVATPMGRYQIVGATLKQTAKEMGLPNNLVFTPEVQDAMFHHLAKKALSGKETIEAKREALRGIWAGFKKVPNSELDKAIAQFEGTEPPTYTALQRESGAMKTTPSVTSRPEPRPTRTAGLDVPQRATERPIQRPAEVSTETPTVEGEKVTPEGSQSLRAQTTKLLNRLGVKPEDVPSFDSEDAVRQALAAGDIKEGDVVIINGQVVVL